MLQSCAVDPGGVASNIWNAPNSWAAKPPTSWVVNNIYAPISDGATAVVHAGARFYQVLLLFLRFLAGLLWLYKGCVYGALSQPPEATEQALLCLELQKAGWGGWAEGFFLDFSCACALASF